MLVGSAILQFWSTSVDIVEQFLTINIVLPNANFGPVLDKRQGRPSTAAWVLSFFLNEGVDELLTTEPRKY
jgi:hypothetical protein